MVTRAVRGRRSDVLLRGTLCVYSTGSTEEEGRALGLRLEDVLREGRLGMWMGWREFSCGVSENTRERVMAVMLSVSLDWFAMRLERLARLVE